jgi:hypothetical protein
MNGLTERQELLLCRYFDGECGYFSTFAAQFLLRRRHEAREFLAQLSSISRECQSVYSQNEGSPCTDLWTQIAARIESEERAAFYLGDRREDTKQSPVGFMHRLYNPQAVIGGLSGAALAAIALTFVTRSTHAPEILTVARSGSSSVSSPSEVTQVSLGQASSRAPSSNLGLRQRPSTSTMEVDWMRANGPLALIQNPHGKSAIIWVRRKPGAVMRNARQPVPASPTLQMMLGEGLDETALERSK